MDTGMQDYYAARAPEYDRVYLKPERQEDLRAIERWLPSVFTRKSVLEVACGTGYWTQFIAPVATRVLAVDASPETLQIAQTRLHQGKVQFLVGDAYRLPVAARRYEAGFAGFWFSHVPRERVGEFLRGFHQALVPGARVVLLDNLYVSGSSTPISEWDPEGNSYQLRRLADGSTYRVIKNFPSEAELRKATTGLATEVRLHKWKYFWALEYAVAAP